LGDAVTPEVAAAWSEVLMLLATELIGREEALYERAENRVGGWRDIKEFVITKVFFFHSTISSTLPPLIVILFYL
jgi:nitric oxide dioxygenase